MGYTNTCVWCTLCSNCYAVPGQSGWSVWTATMQCTSPCIDGIRTVERRCIGEGHCIGNSTKTVSCGSSTCGKLCFVGQH